MKNNPMSTFHLPFGGMKNLPIIGTFFAPFSNHWNFLSGIFQSLEKMKTATVTGFVTVLACTALTGSAQGAVQTLVYIYGQVQDGTSWLQFDMAEASGVWRTTVQYTASSAWHEFVFGNAGWAATWKAKGSGSHDLNDNEQRAVYSDGLDSTNIWSSFTQNMYYTYTIQDVANGSDAQVLKMPTTNAPISIVAVSDNVNFVGDGAVTVTIKTSEEPSGEGIYVRYTTNTWTNSLFVQASGSGTNWTASIPDQGDNTSVQYYIMTTTIASPNHDYADLQTIAYGNNGGSNYAYVQPPTVVAKITFEDYTSGMILSNQSGASDFGVSGTWYSDSSNTTIIVSNTTLVYSNGSIHIYGGTNAVYMVGDSSADNIERTLNSTLNYGAGVVRYMGFLFVRNGTFTTSSRAYVALDNDSSTTAQMLGGGIQGSTTTNNFAQLSTSKLAAGTQAATNTVYYYVAKFEAGASGWTNVTVYINPTSRVAEQAEFIYSLSDSGWSINPDRIAIRYSGSSAAKTYYIDQITIGQTWGDVVYSNSHSTLVVLYSFSVADEDGSVVVRWRTASEKNTVGFYVQRWNGEQFVNLHESLILSAMTGMGASYSFVDETAVPGGTYSYRLLEIENIAGVDHIQEYGPFERTASALQFNSPITMSDDGVVIHWLSREDEKYNIQRAANLMTGFETIASCIPATPPENTYTDTLAEATGYYRIEVNQEEE